MSPTKKVTEQQDSDLKLVDFSYEVEEAVPESPPLEIKAPVVIVQKQSENKKRILKRINRKPLKKGDGALKDGMNTLKKLEETKVDAGFE